MGHGNQIAVNAGITAPGSIDGLVSELPVFPAKRGRSGLRVVPNYEARAALVDDLRAVMVGDALDAASVLEIARHYGTQRFYVHASCVDDEPCVILINDAADRTRVRPQRYHVGLRHLDDHDQAMAINTLMDYAHFMGFRYNDHT